MGNCLRFIANRTSDPREVLHLDDRPVPKPKPSQILVKVYAVALNPAGYKVIKYFPGFMVKKPCIPEFDISGTIAAVGTQVNKWKVGDEVYGITGADTVFKTGHGGLAEYTVLEQDHMYTNSQSNLTARCRKPDFISWEEASSIPLTALTAYKAERVDPNVPLSTGGSIFVNGGSGGVGLYAIQIARHLVGDSGKVVATCSAKNVELVKQNGADEVIDYTSVNVPSHLVKTYEDQKFDIVLDAIGSFDIFKACAAFLKPKGIYLMIGAPIPASIAGFFSMGFNIVAATCLPGFLGGVPRKFRMTMMSPTKETVAAIGELVDQRVIKPVLDSVWKFDDEGIKAAYSIIMSHRARGKVVIKVQ